MYSFSGSIGNGGTAGLFQATDGKFYGTYGGGNSGDAVYSLDVSLAPFVTFVAPSGKVGKTAQILGQGLTGSTQVTFNGVAASFTVVSDTYLTAVVPTGATTGAVVVTTPTGTLTSNKSFVVGR